MQTGLEVSTVLYFRMHYSACEKHGRRQCKNCEAILIVPARSMLQLITLDQKWALWEGPMYLFYQL